MLEAFLFETARITMREISRCHIRATPVMDRHRRRRRGPTDLPRNKSQRCNKAAQMRALSKFPDAKLWGINTNNCKQLTEKEERIFFCFPT